MRSLFANPCEAKAKDCALSLLIDHIRILSIGLEVACNGG